MTGSSGTEPLLRLFVIPRLAGFQPKRSPNVDQGLYCGWGLLRSGKAHSKFLFFMGPVGQRTGIIPQVRSQSQELAVGSPSFAFLSSRGWHFSRILKGRLEAVSTSRKYPYTIFGISLHNVSNILIQYLKY